MPNARTSSRASKTKKAASTPRFPWLTPVLGHILEWSFYVLLFLLPVFFLPWTQDILELSKHSLLLVGTVWIVFVYALRILGSRIFEVKWSPIYWGVGGILFAWLIASAFSHYPFMSFMGIEGQQFLSFSTLASCALLVFIAVNTFTSRQITNSLYTLVISSSLVSLFGLAQLFGAYIFPWDFAQTNGFNTIGLTSVWGFFCSVSLLLGIALIIRLSSLKRGKNILPILLSLFVLLNLIVLILMDVWRIWVSLLGGLVFLLVVLFIKLPKEQKVAWLTIPVFVSVVSLVMLFMNIPTGVNRPLEAMTSYGTGYSVALKTIKSSPLVGYGPGTFIQSYTKFRSSEINKSNFLSLWSVRFDQANSELATKLAATGLLGAAAMIAFFVLLVMSLGKNLSRSTFDNRYTLVLGVSATLVTLLLGKALFPSAIVLTVLFWFLIAIIILLTASTNKVIKGLKSSRYFLGSIAVFSVVVIACIAMTVCTVRVYLADANYSNGRNIDASLSSAIGNGDNSSSLDSMIKSFDRATSLNQYHHGYRRAVSQALLYKLSTLDGESDDISSIASQAIETAKSAVALNESDVRNSLTLAELYRALLPITEGVEGFAREAYEKSIELEPNNPSLYSSYAALYISAANINSAKAADLEGDEKDSQIDKARSLLSKAEDQLNRAIELKEDYARGYYQIAVIRAQLGQKEDAMKKLELATTHNASLIEIGSGDANLFYGIGKLYKEMSENEFAKVAFALAVQTEPGFDIARLELAMIAAVEGDTDDAIEILNSLLEKYPDNEALKSAREYLKNPPPVEPSTNTEETSFEMPVRGVDYTESMIVDPAEIE